MKLVDRFREELESEAPRTQRVLERVPAGRDDWMPHPKSMPLGQLAGLVAAMPSWISMIIDRDELNLTPPPGQGTFRQPARDELVSVHDENVRGALQTLSRTTDDFLLTTKWRLLAGKQVVLDQPRYVVIRDTLNHLVHHRGQLTVYLRLCEVPVPAVYGPSADDPTFA
ncbi:MAG TPA: DinB family protein [Vicinamibacterales bacterium]|nr:DinB family protein [Vicinamibacterales bacterium]